MVCRRGCRTSPHSQSSAGTGLPRPRPPVDPQPPVRPEGLGPLEAWRPRFPRAAQSCPPPAVRCAPTWSSPCPAARWYCCCPWRSTTARRAPPIVADKIERYRRFFARRVRMAGWEMPLWRTVWPASARGLEAGRLDLDNPTTSAPTRRASSKPAAAGGGRKRARPARTGRALPPDGGGEVDLPDVRSTSNPASSTAR